MGAESWEKIKTDDFFQRVLPQVEQRNHVAADGRQDEENSIIVE